VTRRVDTAVAAMSGAAAPPRRNGELVFEAPWQGRAFGMAVAVVERLGLEWKVFQQRLIAEIAAHPEAAYYDCWVAALERLVFDTGTATAEEFEAVRGAVRADES